MFSVKNSELQWTIWLAYQSSPFAAISLILIFIRLIDLVNVCWGNVHILLLIKKNVKTPNNNIIKCDKNTVIVFCWIFFRRQLVLVIVTTFWTWIHLIQGEGKIVFRYKVGLLTILRSKPTENLSIDYNFSRLRVPIIFHPSNEYDYEFKCVAVIRVPSKRYRVVLDYED